MQAGDEHSCTGPWVVSVWFGDRSTSRLAGKLEIFGNEMANMIQIVQRCRIFGTSKSVACEAVRTGESASSRAGVWMPKLG